jgi:ferredoxin
LVDALIRHIYITGNFKKEKNMAHTITDECIACGACQSVCPVEAIKEGDTKYSIDPEKCTDCGACASACPVEAIKAP